MTRGPRRDRDGPQSVRRTHHAHEPLALESGTRFAFVTGSSEVALEGLGDVLHGLALVQTVARPAWCT